mmetsp:Transcript_1072/g.660  ORF Transcript_1072/g.660 Transcript_1072/m.660 type:complete len:99 (+) Transcript_1072:298-594(+)
MKFLCTNFWQFVFSKQVDNLRTNNSGTFIMIDEAFKFIARLSCEDNESKEYKDRVKCYESFVVGLLKGALLNMGFDNGTQVSSQIQGSRMQLTINVTM